MQEEERKPINSIVKERFNEQLNYLGAPKSKKDEALSAYSKSPISIAGASQQ